MIRLKTFQVRAGLAALAAAGILSGPSCRVHVHEEPRREVVVVEERPPQHDVIVVERRQPGTEVVIMTAPPTLETP